MTAVNPPYACQGRTDHPAVLFRMALAGLASQPQAVGATTGVGGVNPVFGNRLAVGGLASMNVSIDTGLVYVPNTTAWNGMYACYNTASFNVAIAVASATQWRRDYIVAQVVDPGDNTANWNAVAVTGTFSSSAPGPLPSLPSNCVPLAIVNVVPNMTVTNGGGTVQDARYWQALQGPLITTSSSRPSLSCPNGTMWYEMDTGLVGIILNGAYQYLVAGAAPDTWHSLGTLAGYTVTQGRWRRKSDGDTEVEIVVTPNGANAASVNFANAIASGAYPVRSYGGPTFPLSANGTTAPTFQPRVLLYTSSNVTPGLVYVQAPANSPNTWTFSGTLVYSPT